MQLVARNQTIIISGMRNPAGIVAATAGFLLFTKVLFQMVCSGHVMVQEQAPEITTSPEIDAHRPVSRRRRNLRRAGLSPSRRRSLGRRRVSGSAAPS